MTTENTAETITTDPVALARNPEAQSLLKNYVIASTGLGLIPVPAADLVALMALEVKLVHGLAKHFEVPFKENLGKSLVSSLVSGGSSAIAIMGLSSLAKAVPALGTLGGGASVAITAGAVTYAVGEVFIKHFESGGTMLDFDTSKTRELFESKLKEGMEVACNLKKKIKADETVEEANTESAAAETVATQEADMTAPAAAHTYN
ncbi:MAG: YcjF family protein [Methylococcaceae bacterium]